MRASMLSLAIVLALAGCDQNHSEASRDSKTVTIAGGNGGTVTISGNGQHYAMKSSNGNQTVEVNTNGSASGLPNFVPVFPGAKVQSSVVGSGGGGNGGSLVIEADAPVGAVIAFYKHKTENEGLGQTMYMQTGGSTLFAAGTGKKAVQIVASADNGGTRAQITWSAGN
jgi:hypothetical protein